MCVFVSVDFTVPAEQWRILMMEMIMLSWLSFKGYCNVEQSLQQQIVRPAAKAKVASRNPADYARSDYGDYGFEMVGNK